jgi:hypothetical protein
MTDIELRPSPAGEGAGKGPGAASSLDLSAGASDEAAPAALSKAEGGAR